MEKELILANQYLDKIKEVCTAVDGNILQMPAAIQCIIALINEHDESKKDNTAYMRLQKFYEIEKKFT